MYDMETDSVVWDKLTESIRKNQNIESWSVRRRKVKYDTSVSDEEFLSSIVGARQYEQELFYRACSLKYGQVVDNSKYLTEDGDIKLPREIEEFAGSKAYLNKYRKIARVLGVEFLMKAYKMSLTKGNPSHWFGKALSIERLEYTIEQIKQNVIDLTNIFDMANTYGIRINTKYISFILFAYYCLGSYKFEQIMSFCSHAKNPSHAFGRRLKNALTEWLTEYRIQQRQA